MKTLYITEQGAKLHKEKQRLVVRKSKELLGRFPAFEIKRVLLFGGVQITTQAQGFLMDQGIDVSFHTLRGRLRGRLISEESSNYLLRLAQYQRHSDESFKLAFAYHVIAAKIANQRAVLSQHARNHPEDRLDQALEACQVSLESLSQADSIPAMMGHEGSASQAYFGAFSAMLRQPSFAFPARSRRPARDPANALLNFGYALLRNELASLLTSMGFEPFLSFLHGLRQGRRSLSLDMMEEFRQPVVDRFVLTLINRKQLQADDFDNDPELGVTLKKAALKRFLRLWEERLENPPQGHTRYRDAMRLQVEELEEAIMQGRPYIPFVDL